MTISINSKLLRTNFNNQKQNNLDFDSKGQQNLSAFVKDEFVKTNQSKYSQKAEIGFTGGKNPLGLAETLEEVLGRKLEPLEEFIAGTGRGIKKGFETGRELLHGFSEAIFSKKAKEGIEKKPIVMHMSSSDDAEKARRAAEKAERAAEKMRIAAEKIEAAQRAEAWREQARAEQEAHRFRMESMERQAQTQQEIHRLDAGLTPEDRAGVDRFMDDLHTQMNLESRGILTDLDGKYYDATHYSLDAPHPTIPKDELSDYLATRDSGDIHTGLDKVDSFIRHAEETLGFRGDEHLAGSPDIPEGAFIDDIGSTNLNNLGDDLTNPIAPATGQIGEQANDFTDIGNPNLNNLGTDITNSVEHTTGKMEERENDFMNPNDGDIEDLLDILKKE